MSDPSSNQYAENKRIGDGQRGQDEHRPYPAMMYSPDYVAPNGTEPERGVVIVHDMGEMEQYAAQGYTGAPGAPVDPVLSENAALRAQIAALTAAVVGDEPRRGPGRPPRSQEA